jgi:HEAT repeat protein
MGHFTATTLGVLEAACVLVLAVAIACLIAAQTRRARRCDASKRRRDGLLDALRHARRGPLLTACVEARTSQNAREDVRAIAGGLALAPQRVLLVEAARAAGLDDALRASLTSSDAGDRSRAVSLLGLLRLAPSSQLEPLLIDPEPEVRLASARAIAMLDTPEGARALMRALVEGAIDPDRLVEQLARPSAVPELVRAFGDAELAPARPRLAEALGLTRSPAGIAPLTALVRIGVEEERVRACHALARIATPEIVPLLVEALADDAWAVRAEAARGLTGRGDASCVPELERALSDGAWWVRANAAEALRSIGPPGVAALVRASVSGDRITAAPAREALALEDPLDGPDDEGLGLAA